jgi:hypothetical protein
MFTVDPTDGVLNQLLQLCALQKKWQTRSRRVNTVVKFVKLSPPESGPSSQKSSTPEHLRAYFHERYPRLLEVELRRRPRSEVVLAALAAAGFTHVETRNFWETRRVYATFDELADDLRQRVDRSILHELSDTELADLIVYVRERLPEYGPYPDASRWTLWWGVKPV